MKGNHRATIDGNQTTLTYEEFSPARGHQYRTPSGSSHGFPFKLEAGQRFRTNGRQYEILD